MDLSSLIKLQAQLDETVLSLNKTQLDEQSILLSRKTALIVEFYEFLNETKLFKYGTNSTIDTDKLKEEYIDIIHFTLSLSIIYKKEDLISQYKLGISPEDNRANMFVESQTSQRIRVELLNVFFDGMKGIHQVIESENFEEGLGGLKVISQGLALTEEEIHSLYLSKGETNFARLGVSPKI